MKGSINKKKTAKGKTQYYAVIELDPAPDGKRRRKSLGGFASRAVAKEALTKAMVQTNEGTFVEPNKETVREFFEQWLKDKEVNVRYNTYKKYQWLTNTYVIPRLGGLQIRQLGPQHLQGLYGDLQRMEKPLSKRSILHLHNMIHNGLEQAMLWGLVPRNVADVVKPPRPEHPEIHTWSRDDVTRFLHTVRESPFYTVFLLAVSTGMRKEEICGLRWQDVDWEHRRLQVRHAMVYHSGKGLVLEGVKTDKSRRDVAVDDFVLNELKKHRTAQTQQRWKFQEAYHDLDLVNSRPDGRPIAYETLHKHWKRAIQEAGLPDIRFHDLRHTHVTLLFELGISSKEIAERVGHSRTSVTDDTYTHVRPARHDDIADRFAQSIYNQK